MKNDRRSIFAENLKELLKKNNMTQMELSKKLGTKWTTVSNWTSAACFPRAEALEKLAQIFSVTPGELIGTYTEINKEQCLEQSYFNFAKEMQDKKCLFNELNFKPVNYKDKKGETRPMYLLDRDFSTFLIMGFTGEKADAWKIKYIKAFNEMEKHIKEEQLFLLKDKEHQKLCMNKIHDLLPELEQVEPLPYIKSNTIVNKAVSNKFGLDKMIKKSDMTKEMLIEREQCLEDFTKLYEVIQDVSKVKEILYTKYQKELIDHVG